MILYPHGGPHSLRVALESKETSFYAEMGIATMAVNYRGSLGFGSESIRSLPGNVGTNDVRDCKEALDRAISLGCDKEKCFVSGGSHGGFLTLHLIGQYPDVFKAAVTRNPVGNLVSMCGVTDIPDWIWYESGLELKDETNIARACSPGGLSAEKYQKMWERSPLYHVNNVKTPIQFHVGDSDLRVPPSQSIEFSRALLSNGVKCEVIWYKGENHPLGKVETQEDTVLNGYKFFSTYL